MGKRQFHGKSRNGCQNCKKRHLKCDEQGPPCANCIARKIDCAYSQTEALATHICATINGPSSQKHGVGVVVPTPTIVSFDSSELRETSFTVPRSRRIVELELIHRWTSTTWKSFCATEEDGMFLQNTLPRLAFQQDFLLDGIMAVTALDIVVCSGWSDTTAYMQVALELYSQSSASFRQHLTEITEQNCHLYFICSLFIVAMNLVLPKYVKTISGGTTPYMDNIKTFFELAHGSGQVASTYDKAFAQSSNSVGIVRSILNNKDFQFMENQTKRIIDRLEAINNRLHPPTSNEEVIAPRKARSTRDMYRSVIRLLGIYHAEDEKGNVKGLYLSIANESGEDFWLAVKESASFALLLLIHWAVLMERQSEHFWWTRSVGPDLIEEVMPLIERSELTSLSLVREHIVWIRREVSPHSA